MYVILSYDLRSTTLPLKLLNNICKDILATSSDFNKVPSGSIPKLAVRIGVLVRWGFIQFILILSCSHSSAISYTKSTTAAFVEEFNA